MPHFCLLSDPGNYAPDGSNLFTDESSRAYWLDHFSCHFEETLRHAMVQYGRTVRKQIDAARESFMQSIENLREAPDALGNGPFDVLGLCQLREKTLRDHALPDPFMYVKERENVSAIEMYGQVIQELHDLTGRQKWLRLIKGVFAGNIFDLGSKPTMHLGDNPTDFLKSMENVKVRPWFVDDFDRLVEHLEDSPPARWAKTVIFVDNAGCDFILGVIPLARQLAMNGTQIILAANERPSLNDMTADETIIVLDQLAGLDADLQVLIKANMIQIVSTGNDVPLIDLSEVSDELNEAAADAELVILEGMGRSVESNFDAAFTVDVLLLALLKDQCVAANLGAELFDCICKYVPKESS